MNPKISEIVHKPIKKEMTYVCIVKGLYLNNSFNSRRDQHMHLYVLNLCSYAHMWTQVIVQPHIKYTLATKIITNHFNGATYIYIPS